MPPAAWRRFRNRRSIHGPALRRSATPAERVRWSRLRAGTVGCKGKRQVPIGPSVADFAFVADRVVNEVDGVMQAGAAAYVAARTVFLGCRGFRVLRFTNREVLGNMNGVLQTIRAAPHPTRLIVAIDTADLAAATRLAAAVRPACAMIKLGLQFFGAEGAAGVAALGDRVFLDLKWHDIPATVAGAMAAALPLRPHFVTLHAAGGAAMIRAAREHADRAGADRPKLLAVTVLTSLAAADLAATGIAADLPDHVLRLARLALQSGADGLVCSPDELAPLRAALGPSPILVVPGVRPAGAAANDQSRVATPAEAARRGADYVVVGRPITGAADPAAAAAAIRAELEQAR